MIQRYVEGHVVLRKRGRGLQKDLDRLGEWAKKWQMESKVGKCEVMHFGRRDGGTDYFLTGEMLRKSEPQGDLGVLVLKVNMQIQSAVKKANAMLAFMSRGREYKSRDVFLRLHEALVKPHLDYCDQFWAPYLRKDVLALERVQRRFTGMIPRMKSLSDEERLRTLALYPLEFRRKRGKLAGYCEAWIEWT